MCDNKKTCVIIIAFVMFCIASCASAYGLNYFNMRKITENYKNSIHIDDIKEDSKYVHAMQLEKLNDEKLLTEKYGESVYSETERFFRIVMGQEEKNTWQNAWQNAWKISSIRETVPGYSCVLKSCGPADSKKSITVLCDYNSGSIIKIAFDSNNEDISGLSDDDRRRLAIKKNEILSQTENDAVEDFIIYSRLNKGSLREWLDPLYERICMYNNEAAYVGAVLITMEDEGRMARVVYKGEDVEDGKYGKNYCIGFDIITENVLFIEKNYF